MLLTNPATYDERPLKEARSLASAGYSVTILAWDRDGITKTDSLSSSGVLIKRMRLYAGHGTPKLTVPRLLVFYAWCLSYLAFHPFDALHCHDVDTLPVGLLARALKLGRPKFVYDMHDLPESFLRFFPFTKTTQGIAFDFSKKQADLVIVVSNPFVDYLGSLGFRRDRLVVVMNCPPRSEGRFRTRVRTEFSVIYYGWLGEERGVRPLVEAVEGLANVTLTVAGRGDLEEWLRSVAKRNAQIRFLGWLGMKDLEPLIREADLIPSLYDPRSKNAVLATPGKLLKSLSLSVPALVHSGIYQADIVEKYGCGLVLKWGDTAAIRSAIQRLSSDPEFYAKLSRAAYDAFLTSFSWEVMASRLVEAYAGFLQ